MTERDLKFFQHCFDVGLIKPPFLEIGSAKVQSSTPNLCEIAHALGIQETYGVDLDLAPGVDAVFDFSIPTGTFKERWTKGAFETVAIFNVLEHTFDPFTILQNAASCLAPGGFLLVVVPTVWQVHNYPGDYVRLLPQWYKEFAKRTRLVIQPEAFCWLSSEFGLIEVQNRQSGVDEPIPEWQTLGRGKSPIRYWTSRIVHKLFNTYGRSHWATHVAIGIAFSPDSVRPHDPSKTSGLSNPR